MLNKIKKVDQLILLTEKKVKLLKELKNSILFEASKITIDRQGHPATFFIIDSKTKEVLKAGSPAQLKTWIKKRKYQESEIFNPKQVNI